MSHVEIAPINKDTFTARAIGRGQTATIYMRGEADMQVQAELRRFLEALHKEALRVSLYEAIVDVRELAFLTSSCFKELVTWANTMQAMEPEKRYRVRFISNPKSHWQKRSLFALARFANDVIQVD